MKKFLYILFSVIFFLFFKSNVLAYVKDVTLNYDNANIIFNDSYYTDRISQVRQILDRSDYKYFIALLGCRNKNQVDYDSSCLTDISNHTATFSLYIFNPSYYNESDNTVNGLYFNISGGLSGFPNAIVGPDQADSIYQSNYFVWDATASIDYNFVKIFDLGNSNYLSNINTWLSNEDRTYWAITNSVFNYGYDNSSYQTSNMNLSYSPFYLYKNFNLPGKYLRFCNAQGSCSNSPGRLTYIKDSEIITPVVNEDFPFIIAANQILPPVVNDLGEGTTTYNGNSIKILSNNFNNSIICPNDRAFVNDFCYITNSDFVSSSDMTNTNLTLDFDLGNNYASFSQGHYYSFTFRVSSTSTLNVRGMGVNSGSISTNVNILQVIKHENGVFTDYQIIFTPNSSFTSSYYLSRLYINFNGFVDSDFDSYSYGAYRNYRYHDFGVNQPTNSDINNDYTINNIDTITSDTSSWFNKFHFNDRGLSNFVTSPLRLFNFILNDNNVCQPINVPFGRLGSYTLPCMSTYLDNRFHDFISIYQIFISGLVCYYLGINYFRIIKNSINPFNDKIEVIDL